MLGHEMGWASFHVIEVMSQERFGLKRTGFLAAAQSFTRECAAPVRLDSRRVQPSHTPSPPSPLRTTRPRAAAQTETLILCVALLKKEFGAKSAYEIGTGISTLACIATEDLARDLIGDVVSMLTSSCVPLAPSIYRQCCAPCAR